MHSGFAYFETFFVDFVRRGGLLVNICYETGHQTAGDGGTILFSPRQ